MKPVFRVVVNALGVLVAGALFLIGSAITVLVGHMVLAAVGICVGCR